MIARTISYVDVAGPRVATILARLIRVFSLGGFVWRRAAASLRGLQTDRDIGRAHRSGQLRLAHEVPVDVRGGRAALGDRPDDERLAAPGVAGDEHAGGGGLVVVLAADVAAVGELRAELIFEEARAPGR